MPALRHDDLASRGPAQRSDRSAYDCPAQPGECRGSRDGRARWTGRARRRDQLGVIVMLELTSFVLAVMIAPALGPENSVRRIDLGEAVLVLPEGYRPQSRRADVILHMHGAAPVVEKALVNSGWQGPLLLFHRQGLSSVYSEPFRDP